MPSEGVLDTPRRRVTPGSGKGALGKWRAFKGTTVWTQSQRHGDTSTGRRAGGITQLPRGGYGRAFKPRDGGEDPPGTGCCCQPDSGKPTVRDERGAYGNVSYGRG